MNENSIGEEVVDAAYHKEKIFAFFARVNSTSRPHLVNSGLFVANNSYFI